MLSAADSSAKAESSLLKLQLLPETGNLQDSQPDTMQESFVVGFDKGSFTSRKLLQVVAPDMASNTTIRGSRACPDDVYVGKGSTVHTRNQLCYGAGLKSIEKREQLAHKEERMEAQECVLTVVLPNSTAFNREGLRSVSPSHLTASLHV